MEKESRVDSSEIRNLTAVSLDTGTGMTVREGAALCPATCTGGFAAIVGL